MQTNQPHGALGKCLWSGHLLYQLIVCMCVSIGERGGFVNRTNSKRIMKMWGRESEVSGFVVTSVPFYCFHDSHQITLKGNNYWPLQYWNSLLIFFSNIKCYDDQSSSVWSQWRELSVWSQWRELMRHMKSGRLARMFQNLFEANYTIFLVMVEGEWAYCWCCCCQKHHLLCVSM